MRPRCEHAHAVGEGEGLLLVVGDEHRGGPGVAQDGLDVVPHLRAEVGVEVGERLVEEQQGGRGRQRPRHRHPLLLAAGQLVRVAAAEPGQPHQVEHVADPRPPRRPVQAVQAEADIVVHGEVGEERVVLEHDADAARLGRHEAPGARHHLAAEAHRAGVGGLEAGDEPEGGGLPAAGGAEQGDDLALLDREGQAVHRGRLVRRRSASRRRRGSGAPRAQRRARTSGFTGVSGALPSSTDRQLSTARRAISTPRRVGGAGDVGSQDHVGEPDQARDGPWAPPRRRRGPPPRSSPP